MTNTLENWLNDYLYRNLHVYWAHNLLDYEKQIAKFIIIKLNRI